MSDANVSGICSNKVFIIAVTVVVLIVLFMYFWDQQQQRNLKLRRLERRVEILEEWDRAGNGGGKTICHTARAGEDFSPNAALAWRNICPAGFDESNLHRFWNKLNHIEIVPSKTGYV